MSRFNPISGNKKRCSICKQCKTFNYFYESSTSKNGLVGACKKCLSEQRKEHRKTGHYDKVERRNLLKNKYGMTLEEYDKILEQQNGVCKICGKINLNGKRLAVDHNHKTGKIRGLLCANCNTSLGYVEEDISVLVKMIGYLEKGRRGNPDPTAS